MHLFFLWGIWGSIEVLKRMVLGIGGGGGGGEWQLITN